MKTQEAILERYRSEESVDFFGAQRTALLCLLTYENAKPFLQPEYVLAVEEGNLPEEEKWVENLDVEKEILDLLPSLFNGISHGNEAWALQALMYLKGWMWSIDSEFHDTVLVPLFKDGDFLLDCGKEIADKIAERLNYKPTIEDTEFEEVPTEEPK